MKKETNFSIGKKIFEQEYVGKYNPETKLFENKNGGLRSIYKERNLIELKYMHDITASPAELKTYEWEYLYEGLHTSLEPKEMIKKLQRFVDNGIIRDIEEESLRQMLSKENQETKTPFISFFINEDILDAADNNPEIGEQIDKLYKIIEGYGYFVANVKQALDIDGIEINIITIHPLYIIEVTDSVYNDFNGVLYHVTLKRNWKKIQRTGFIPRNSNLHDDQYPDRIYLFPTDAHFRNELMIKHWFLSDYKNMYKEMLDEQYRNYRMGLISDEKWNYIYNHRYDYRNWVVIKVDLKNKRSYKENDISTHYRFFDDPRCADGIFTYENIDPQCLSILKEFHIEEDSDDFEYFKFKDTSKMKIFEDILDDLERVSSSQRNIDDLTKSRDVVRKDYDNPDDYEYCLVLGILIGNPTQKIEELFDSLSYIADGWKFDNSGFVAVANRQELTERFEFPVYYVPEIKDGFFDKSGVLHFRLMFNVPNFIELSQAQRRKRIFQFINFLATICGIEGKIFQNNFYIHDIYRRDDDNEFKWFQRGDWIRVCRAFLYNQERLTPSNRIRRRDLDIIKEIVNGMYATFYFGKYENQQAQLSKDLKAIFLEQNKKLFKD